MSIRYTPQLIICLDITATADELWFLSLFFVTDSRNIHTHTKIPAPELDELGYHNGRGVMYETTVGTGVSTEVIVAMASDTGPPPPI